MIHADDLLFIPPGELEIKSRTLSPEDIGQLVELLGEKDDKIRYQAFQLLQWRSRNFNDVCPYFDALAEKLKSTNSYQRSIGVMLIADNARWDTERRFEQAFDAFMAVLYDEKPITVRQMIQSLAEVVPYKPELQSEIARRLIHFDLSQVRETMRKSILTDILNVLALIRTYQRDEAVEQYIAGALSGDLLDKKAKKQIQALL